MVSAVVSAVWTALLGGAVLLAWLCRGALANLWHLARFKLFRNPAVAAEALTQSSDAVWDMTGLGRVVFTKSAAVARQVFTTTRFKFVNRLGSNWGLKQLGMYHQGIIWNNDEASWMQQRKWFEAAVKSPKSKGMAGSISDMCIQAFQATVQQFVGGQGLLAAGADSASNGNGPTSPTLTISDATDFMRCCTFRITCALAFGIPGERLDDRLTLRCVHAVTAYFEAWNFFLLRPRWLHLLQLPFCWRQHRRHLAAVADLQQVTRHLTQLGRSGISSPGSASTTTLATGSLGSRRLFLGNVLQAQEKGEISEAQAVQCCLEMLLAGTDTSSVTLGYLLVALRDQPLLEAALRQEVVQALSAYSTEGGHLLRSLGTARLPKLEAALYEAMRYKPVGPVSIRQAARSCPAGGFLLHLGSGGQEHEVDRGQGSKGGWLDGQASEGSKGGKQGGSVRLQAGDTVIVNLAGIHRCPAVFPSPGQFDLANFWLNPAVQLGANFFPFGGGPKGCVGSDLAMLEMQVLAGCFLLTFQFHSNPREPALDGSSRSAPSLAALQSEWQVANQPTELVPLSVRLAPSAALVLPGAGSRCSADFPGPSILPLPGGSTFDDGRNPIKRIYLVGPGASGKTTLLAALRSHPLTRDWVAAYAPLKEVARQVMAERNIIRDDLADPATFLRLQHLIVERQAAAEAQLGGKPFIADRSGAIDTLAYTAWKFGIHSEQVRGLLEQPAFQALLASCSAPDTLLLLVPPFAAPGQPAPDDGTRLLCGDGSLGDAFTSVLSYFEHQVLSTRSVQDRVAEVHSMVGCAARQLAPAGAAG